MHNHRLRFSALRAQSIVGCGDPQSLHERSIDTKDDCSHRGVGWKCLRAQHQTCSFLILFKPSLGLWTASTNVAMCMHAAVIMHLDILHSQGLGTCREGCIQHHYTSTNTRHNSFHTVRKCVAVCFTSIPKCPAVWKWLMNVSKRTSLLTSTNEWLGQLLHPPCVH